jgi:hypothetical protein
MNFSSRRIAVKMTLARLFETRGFALSAAGHLPSMRAQADPQLRGEWRVERLSGLLPPGVGKRIGARSGVTTVFGLPVAPFTVSGRRLVYRWLPIHDALAQDSAGGWLGEGRLAGRRFCRFRLVR